MKVEHVTIQSVLAILVTNPTYTQNNFNNSEELLRPFALATDIRKQLQQFFKEYGKQFLGSTILLKKRRWDNIKQSLQIVSLLFTPQVLDTYWDSYLLQLKLLDSVPKNPLIESIKFCEFIKRDGNLSPVIQALISYEIIRNNTIVSYSLDFQDYKDQPLIYEDGISLPATSRLIVHPCYQIHEFDCNVSSLIKRLNQTGQVESLDAHFIPQAERFLFYKNWQKGGVASMKISSTIEMIIKIIASNRVYELIQQKAETLCQISQETLEKLVGALYKNGVIQLVK